MSIAVTAPPDTTVIAKPAPRTTLTTRITHALSTNSSTRIGAPSSDSPNASAHRYPIRRTSAGVTSSQTTVATSNATVARPALLSEPAWLANSGTTESGR
jgi:hypothetical protein